MKKRFTEEQIIKALKEHSGGEPGNRYSPWAWCLWTNFLELEVQIRLCVATLNNAVKAFPEFRGSIIHSDRGAQYTSEIYHKMINKFGIVQSMNSDGGRCHDNARYESMWARMKSELLYDRYDTEKMPVEDVKVLVWRYFISYWNNRRICSANEGLPPAVKRQHYYDTLTQVA